MAVINATNVRDQSNEPDSVEEMELDEPDLNILVKNKKAGFWRSAPQTEPYQTRIEDGSFTCSVCQFEANSKQNLMKHKNTAHNTKEIVGRYTCEICGNNFQSSEELHVHFSCHLNSCDQCDEMFQSKSDFEIHLQSIHNKIIDNSDDNDKNEIVDSVQQTKYNTCFKCTQCENKFKSKTEVTIHMQTKHTDDGDWFCHECDYQTNSYTNLRNHIERTGHVSHIIEPNKFSFRCKSCYEVHSSKSDLNKHIQMVHTKHKPCIKFQANKCEWDGECIYKHIVMKENEIACFTCGEIFTSKTTLMRHIKKEHGNVLCQKFLNNQCEFSNTSCLFTHSKGETINTFNEN